VSRRPAPHDFLLHLRTREPLIARRFDGIQGMSWDGNSLRITVPEGS
jgi:hypothetical protein